MSHSNVRPVGGALDTDHIYYNITYSNDGTGSTVDSSGNVVELSNEDNELTFSFNQTRAQPYLSRPKDYYLSVIRFTIESPNVPVFIPQPIVGQSDVNKLIYAISIVDASGNCYKQNVQWIQQDKTAVVPIGPVTRDYISPALPYYWCYSYQHFLECVNNTFKKIWVDNTLIGNAPYIYYDECNGLFTLAGDLENFRTTIDGAILGNYNIYFNTELLNLFSSLPAKFVAGTVSVLAPADNLLLDYLMILSTGSDVATSSTQPFSHYIRYNAFTNTNDVFALQEYPTLPLWTPITAIMFKTSLLTVAPENMATPVVYENNLNINSNKQHAEVFYMLIDHYAPLNTGTEYRPYIYYEPTGEYKLTNLYGEKEVNAIDVSVFWRDNFGNLIPFSLGLGCSSTLKIMFRRKTFNSE